MVLVLVLALVVVVVVAADEGGGGADDDPQVPPPRRAATAAGRLEHGDEFEEVGRAPERLLPSPPLPLSLCAVAGAWRVYLSAGRSGVAAAAMKRSRAVLADAGQYRP